jgi:hypothetical protein
MRDLAINPRKGRKKGKAGRIDLKNRHCDFFLQLYNLFCSCAMYFAVVLFLLEMC